MISLWKETLLPGTQVDAKSKRPFTITDADVTDAKRNINRMVAKGRRIPLVYEHLDVEESDPEEWKANYARNTFGWVGGAKLSTLADVKAGVASRAGTLLVRHDVHDERDAKQVMRTGFVSPKIYRGYLDSQGERYRGVTVAHVASSPTVCQFWQAPFALNLSDSDALYLSYAPPDDDSLESPETENCPLYDIPYRESFEEWLDGLDLSTTDPEEVPAVADDYEKKPKVGADSEGGNADLTAIVKALKDRFGAKISDKVSNWGELLIAIESNGEAMPEEEPDADNGNPDDDLPGAADDMTAGAGAPPMVMSTLDANPVRQKRAVALAKPERDAAAKEAKQLFEAGMMTAQEYRLLDRQNAAFEMSFTADLEPAGKWAAKVAKKLDEVRKRTKPVWTPTGKRGATGVDLSTTGVDLPNLGAAPKPERVQAGVDVILGKKSANEV